MCFWRSSTGVISKNWRLGTSFHFPSPHFALSCDTGLPRAHSLHLAVLIHQPTSSVTITPVITPRHMAGTRFSSRITPDQIQVSFENENGIGDWNPVVDSSNVKSLSFILEMSYAI